MVKTFNTGNYEWIYPDVDTLNKFLDRINQVGGLDYGYLANCRPDVGLASDLWKNKAYRIDDGTVPDKRLYSFPGTEVLIVLTDSYDDHIYVDLHEGLTEDQFGAMLLGYTVKRYPDMTEEEFQDEVDKYKSPDESEDSGFNFD